MKRFLSVSLLLVLGLAACSSGGSTLGCQGNICLGIEIEGPVRAQEATVVTATIRAKEDIPGLAVSLLSRQAGTILGLLRGPEGAEVLYQDEYSVDWRIDAKAGETYTFSIAVAFDQPRLPQGVFGRTIGLLVSHPSMAFARDSTSIYLDAEGNQIEASKARGDTEFLLPVTVVTGPPDPSPTPTATAVPSATALPPTATPSPTAPAYPPPEDDGPSSSGQRMETPMPYPYPPPE